MTHRIYGKRFWRLDRQLRDGPVGPLVDAFASQLLSQGYPRRYLRVRFTVIAELNRWLIRKNLGLAGLNESRTRQFIRYRSTRAEPSRRGEIATLNKFIALAKRRGAVPVAEVVPNPKIPFEEMLSAYKEHLIERQGLASSTVSRYLLQVGKFLPGVLHRRPSDVSQISAQDIMGFISEYAGEHNGSDSCMMVGSIRSFLRFLVFEGKIDSHLAECVPGVPSRRHTRLPSHLSPGELEHLLKCCQGTDPVGRRNYAILLLLSRLGLRASEVARITLDDIDWERGRLTIRGKGKRQTPLPLPVEVGDAVVGYLKHARPRCASRRVFISARAPYRPFKNGCAVSTLVNRAVKRAGLNPRNKGAHLLRHTLATEWLGKGATLTEVGEILRHQAIDTTAIYAKVDFPRLRKVVMQWPTPRLDGGPR